MCVRVIRNSENIRRSWSHVRGGFYRISQFSTCVAENGNVFVGRAELSKQKWMMSSTENERHNNHSFTSSKLELLICILIHTNSCPTVHNDHWGSGTKSWPMKSDGNMISRLIWSLHIISSLIFCSRVKLVIREVTSSTDHNVQTLTSGVLWSRNRLDHMLPFFRIKEVFPPGSIFSSDDNEVRTMQLT